MIESFVSRVWLAMVSAVAMLVVACGDATSRENVGEVALPLTAPTEVSTFALLTSGGLGMQDRSHVTGGNVGVAGGAVNGANSITTGFDCRLGVGNGVIGRRMVLSARTAAGDLFVTQLLASGATFTSQSAFALPPALPPIGTVTAGTTALTVNSGQTVTRAAGNLGLVTVNGTLRLSGGTYQFQNLVLGNGGVLQPTAPSIVRVAGRVTGGDRVRLLPAAPLGASALRLIVAGANDTNGGVSLGGDGQMAALVVSRASFRAGDRFNGSGAIAASNVNFAFDSRFAWNTGFACNSNAGCNDNNPCTTDTCSDARCVNTVVSNGTACPGDGNACTNDRCTNGVCTHPAVANGSACTLPNANGTCSAGTCGLVTCNAGFGDCDVDPTTGCETGILSDESNCGQCGAACFVQNGVAACANGLCTDDILECFGDFDDCDLDPANGCETNVQADESNCGQCGAACFVQNGVAACANGLCTDDILECFGDFDDCDLDPANGCETNVQADESNCGQCGAACFVQNGVAACSNGLCTDDILECFGGFDDCDLDPANGCETDILGDESNCGQCGAACFVQNGVAACSDGLCTDDIIGCFAGFGDCDLDPANGCEHDLGNDPENCGDCGISCNVNGTGTCANGTCSITSCDPTFDSCDNDPNNGCETDLLAPTSCGQCDNVCSFGSHNPFCAGEQCTCTEGSPGLPGSCATCQDQHAAVVKDSRTVTLTGFSSAPLDLIVVSALKDQSKNPADCAVQQDNSLWQDLTPNGLSEQEVAFTRASPFPEFPRLNFYQWTVTLTVPAELWPDGGLARLRIIGGPAFEDDPAIVAQDPTQSCVARDPEVKRSFANLVDLCAGTSIFKVCPNQVGTRQIVTLVDPSPTPGEASKVVGKTCTGGGKTKDLGHFLNNMEPNLAGAPDPCNYDDCGPGKQCEADNYYAAVDPEGKRKTLSDWIAANPPLAGTTEMNARYYNTGDLGVGRDMHCWYTAQGASCYVSNFGAAFVANPFTQEEALQQTVHHEDLGIGPVATVAMEWREVCPIVNGQPDCTVPHPHEDEVQFFTFGPDGQRINKVQLDSEGEKPVPGNCITCHGGTYDLATHKVKNANFLPFDTCAFAFSSEHGYTLADQQHTFQQLNLLVWITQPEDRGGGGITEFLEGVYRVGNQPFGTDIQDERWVPSIWQGSLALEQAYLEVAKPYCRACHLSRETKGHTLDPFLLQSAAGPFACTSNFHLMPHAERTQNRFWQSSARATLINAANEGTLVTPAGGGCAP